MNLKTLVNFREVIPALAFVMVSMLTVSPAFAVDPFNVGSNGVTLKGYDPVAYFQESKPVKGSKEFEYEWMGVKWYFSNTTNRDLFAQEPEKYAPQYGGYCAWAVSQGYTADIDPDAWTIFNDRLYLNYNKKVRKTWQQDIPGNIAKADKNWPNLLNK